VKQRLRIFVSSPGDVERARRIAALTIEEVAREHSRFKIEPYLWEYEAMVASGHFQDSIEPPSSFDIVVLILWSRLGTHLPERTKVREYRGLDGRTPVTGTEWEFEEALKAAQERGAPDLLVYRSLMNASFDTSNPDRFEQQSQQLKALNTFWERHFRNKGMFIAAYTTFERDAEFAQSLKTHLGQLIKKRLEMLAQVQGDRVVAWTHAPFRGLESYEYEHAAIFFGQNEAIVKATLQLAANAEAGSPFLLVMGASGSGKSSLVKAGVVPSLCSPRIITGTTFLRRVIFRPSDAREGEDLFDALARRLTTQVSADEGLSELIGPGQSVAMLAAHLRGSTAEPAFPLGSALGQLSVQARQAGSMLEHETATLILVVDQLEELFTIKRKSIDEAQRFVELLSGLVRSGVVWVIATMRRDFWYRADETPELLRLSEKDGRLELEPPGPAQLSQMIRRPAEEAGFDFEEDDTTHVPLNEVIAEEVAREPGGLPLLSYLLDQLYQKDVRDDHRNTLTYETYRKLDGLKGAIATRAEEVLQRCTREERDSLGSVLFSLVRLGAAGADVERAVARRVPLSTFEVGTPQRRLVEAFLDPHARLLVSDAEHGARPTVRIAHEALISSWKRAEDYVEKNEESFLIRQRIEDRYLRWRALQDSKPTTAPDVTEQSTTERSRIKAWSSRFGREPGLLSDIDISDGRRLLQDHRADTESHLVDYIERSIGQDRRIRMRAVRVLALVAIIVTVLAIIAFTQRNFARSETAIANTTAQFMVHMFENADPAKSGGDRITARQMLDVGATTIRSETDLAHAPRVRSELQTTIGRAYTALGLYPPAQTALSQARADQAAAWVPDESRIRTLLASGTTLYFAGNDDEASPYLHQAADLARKSLKASNPLHSEALTGLADLLAADGKYPEAEQLCREALEADRQRGSSSEDKAVLANTLDSLGTTFYYRGDLRAAETPMREALKIREDVFGMDHPLTAASLTNLGAVLYQSGQYDEALALYKLALPIDEKVYDPEHPAVAGILNDMGRSLLMAGDVNAAEPLLRRSLAITEKTEGEQHQDMVAPLNSLAMIDSYNGHLEAARKELQRAESIARPPEHRELLDQVLLNEASMELPGGDRARAGVLLAESKALLQKAHPDAKTDAWRYAVWDMVNAGLVAANGDTAAAISMLAAAQTVIDARFGPTSYYSQLVKSQLKTLEKTSSGKVAS
jgi:tetratricopeptide (TPR) repeat protein